MSDLQTPIDRAKIISELASAAKIGKEEAARVLDVLRFDALVENISTVNRLAEDPAAAQAMRVSTGTKIQNIGLSGLCLKVRDRNMEGVMKVMA